MTRTLRTALIATLASSALGLAFAQTPAENPATPAPKHEKQARDIVRAAHPGMVVTTSHEVDPAFVGVAV